MIKLGTFLYCLDKKTIHLWEIYWTEKLVIIRKEYKQGLHLGSKLVKALQGLLTDILDSEYFSSCDQGVSQPFTSGGREDVDCARVKAVGTEEAGWCA